MVTVNRRTTIFNRYPSQARNFFFLPIWDTMQAGHDFNVRNSAFCRRAKGALEIMAWAELSQAPGLFVDVPHLLLRGNPLLQATITSVMMKEFQKRAVKVSAAFLK